jgi:5'-3' exonuclease
MPPARPTLYLVDAMSNIHRAYHAIRGLSTSAGRPTNAVYGFVNMLRKMLREHPSDHLAVAFDRAEKTVRHEEYDAYKANRPAMEADLATQIPDIRRACEAYRIPVLEMPGYEADDVIGTLATRAEQAGFDVVIVTADKDMLQLVSGSRVRVFHTGREKFLDEKGVAEFFGVLPSQVVDVLALMGDASDNIPGVPRVGEVTAKKWISEHGSLDRLLENAEQIKGKVGESLREHKEDALLSRRLAAIRKDLPIPFEPDALRRSAPDNEKLKALFVELEFNSLAAEIQGEETQAQLSSGRLSAKESFRLEGSGPHGVAVLSHDSNVLLAAGSGASVQIAEEPAGQIRARWMTLAQGGAALATHDAKPLDRLLAPAGAGPDLFDVGLAQYVLSSGGSPPTRRPGSPTACSARSTRSRPPTAGSPSARRERRASRPCSRRSSPSGPPSRRSTARSSGRSRPCSRGWSFSAWRSTRRSSSKCPGAWRRTCARSSRRSGKRRASSSTSTLLRSSGRSCSRSSATPRQRRRPRRRTSRRALKS